MIAALPVIGAIWLAVCAAFVPLWAYALRDRRREEREAERAAARRRQRIAAVADRQQMPPHVTRPRR